jgi:hypothetical protein
LSLRSFGKNILPTAVIGLYQIIVMLALKAELDFGTPTMKKADKSIPIQHLVITEESLLYQVQHLFLGSKSAEM